MKKILLFICLVVPQIFMAQTIPVVRSDNGIVANASTFAGWPAHTNNQVLVGNGTIFAPQNQSILQAGVNYWTLTGSDLYRNSKISVNQTSPPTQAVDVAGALQLRFATTTIDATNSWLHLGGFNTLSASNGGSAIGPLTGFNAAIGRATRTLIIQGASDGLGDGISFVTGSTPAERMSIGLNGSILFNTLSGTGDRIPYLNSSGQLLRGTFDPANLFSGSGTANQMAYFNGGMSITSGANAVFNGTNMSLGGIATPTQRLDVSGALQLRFANTTPDATNGWLHIGGLQSLGAASAGSVIGPLSTGGFRAIRTLVLQGASDGLGEGISFVTGATPTERMNIGLNGSILFNTLSGTGDRIPYLNSSGQLLRGTIDPANVLQSVSVNARLTGNGTAGSPLDLASQSATTGQYLRWNGSAWVPATLTPQSLTDAAAVNNTIFYSTDRSKLCYKDPGGTVNELY